MKSIEFMVDSETGQVKFKPTRRITSRRSIFATDFVVDEVTGEVKLIKHLNKDRVDRSTCRSRTGKWNKTGNRARMKGNKGPYNSKSQRKTEIEKSVED
jgi:hypothetical protein